MKYIITLLLGLFLLEVSSAQNAIIEGPEVVCSGGCNFFGLYSTDGSIISDQLEYLMEVEPYPGAATITFLGGQSQNSFQICFSTPGTYVFSVYGSFGNGESFKVSKDIIVEVSNLYIREVTPMCGNQTSNCLKACPNSTITYEVVGIDSISTQFSWGVTGALSYTSQGNFFTIQWGPEGQGMINVFSFNGLCQSSGFQCVNIVSEVNANFNLSDQVYCKGEPIFIENASDGATKFEWDFGNGKKSTEISPEVSYDTPGTFHITLTATNECGCFDVISKDIVINDLWKPRIDCKGTICENSEVTYTSPENCGVFYWNIIGDGAIVDGGGSSDNFVRIRWGNGPEGFVNLTVDACSNEYCPGVSENRIPIISELAKISGPVKPCKDKVEFYSIERFDASDYQWVINNGSIIAGQGSHQVMVQWGNAATGSIGVSYNNCYLKCGGSDELTVNISSSFVLSNSNNKLCEGDAYQANAKLNGTNTEVQVHWSIVDDSGFEFLNINASNINFNTTGLPSGKYKVYAENNEFCNAIDSLTFELQEATAKVDAITGEQNVCKGNSYAYVAASQFLHTETIWTIHDGSTVETMTGNSILVKWNSNGPYELEVRQRNLDGPFCFSEPISRMISPIVLDPLQYSMDACVEDNITIVGTYYENLKYEWTINPASNAVVINDLTEKLIIKPVTNGPLEISLNLCGAIEKANIEVHSLPVVNVVHDMKACELTPTEVKTTDSYASYKWYDESNNIVSTIDKPLLVPGTYTVEIADINSCKDHESFTIDKFPKPDISISSPEFTEFCPANGQGFPSLHALENQGGYSYEWYEGSTLLPEITPIIQTSLEGLYSVIVTDDNGCTNRSNYVVVKEDCSGGGGNGNGCVPSSVPSFTSATGSDCNKADFTNNTLGMIPGSTQWNFDDLGSGAANFSNLENPSHDFSLPGYFKVRMFVAVPDAIDATKNCVVSSVDIVAIPLAANYDLNNACTGSEVEFFDKSTFLSGYTITSWHWDFGDPSSGSDNEAIIQDPKHTFSQEGTYTVSLTISDGTCTDVITKSILVHAGPEVAFTQSISECVEVAGKYSLNNLNEVADINWNFGDVASGDQNILVASIDGYHSYTNDGNYTVTVNAKSIYGCSNTGSQVVTIFDNLLSGDITSSNGDRICRGESAILTAPLASNYLWSDSTTLSQTITVNEPNQYAVTITDVHGCIYQPDPFLLQVDDRPVLSLLSIVGSGDESYQTYERNIEICQGTDLVLNAEPHAGYTYHWSNNSILSQLNFTNNQTLNAGSYNFIVTVTDNATMCTTVSDTIHVKVNSVPNNFTISANSSGVLCSSTSHVLSVISPINGIQYTWNNGGVGIQNVVQTPGQYQAIATSAEGCVGESNFIEVKAGPDVSKVPFGCFERCKPDTVCMPNLPNIVSYQWTFNGSMVGADHGGNTPNLISTESGDYQLTMLDNEGCSATSELLSLNLLDPFGVVQGTIFQDENKNGVIDGDDTKLSNVVVIIDGVGMATTDINGHYIFEDVPGGSHPISIDETTLPVGANITLSHSEIIIETCKDTVLCDALISADCKLEMKEESFVFCPGKEIVVEGMTFDKDTILTILTELAPGCVDTTRYFLEQSPETHFDFTVERSCGSGDHGSISIFPDRVGEYIYDLLNGNGAQLENTFSSLGGGLYTVEITDEYSCKSTFDGIEVEQLDDIQYQLLNTSINCQASEARPELVLLNYNSDQLNILWSTGDTGLSTVVSAAGPITLTISNACQEIIENIDIDIAEPTVFEYKATPACGSADNGSVTIVPARTGSFNYSLSNGTTLMESNQFTNLKDGVYSVLVTDEHQCETEIENIEVRRLPEVKYELENVDLDCVSGLSHPRIVLNNYDASDLDIHWSNGDTGIETTWNFNGLLSVSIKNECQEVIEYLNPDLLAETKVIKDVTLYSNESGRISDVLSNIIDNYENPTIKSLIVTDRMGKVFVATDEAKENFTIDYFSQEIGITGIYFYVIEFEADVCGQRQVVKKYGKFFKLSE